MERDEILRRISELERQNGEFAPVFASLRETVRLLGVTQQAQGEAQAELELVQLDQARLLRRMSEIQRLQAERQAEHEETTRRIETNLAEITDKLNGLIGYLDSQRREPPNA
jgi:hypothetical protein